jgi:hypothetical protein
MGFKFRPRQLVQISDNAGKTKQAVVLSQITRKTFAGTEAYYEVVTCVGDVVTVLPDKVDALPKEEKESTEEGSDTGGEGGGSAEGAA